MGHELDYTHGVSKFIIIHGRKYQGGTLVSLHVFCLILLASSKIFCTMPITALCNNYIILVLAGNVDVEKISDPAESAGTITYRGLSLFT